MRFSVCFLCELHGSGSFQSGSVFHLSVCKAEDGFEYIISWDGGRAKFCSTSIRAHGSTWGAWISYTFERTHGLGRNPVSNLHVVSPGWHIRSRSISLIVFTITELAICDISCWRWIPSSPNLPIYGIYLLEMNTIQSKPSHLWDISAWDESHPILYG